VTEAEVEHWLGLGTYLVWVAARGEGLRGYTDANERPGRERYWVDLRALDPEAARALVAAAETWAAERAAPGARLHLATPDQDERSGAVLEELGYRIVRYELEMRIELDEEPPEPVWPEGMGVRTFRPGEDDEEGWKADNDSFADHWEFIPDPLPEWREEVLGSPHFDPSLFFLPVEGDAVAGLAYCQLRDLDGPVGWVEILGVRRGWRRRGLGLALLHHSFRELRARGASWAGLEVDAENLTGAVRLYERAGMRPVKRVALWEKEIGPG
jgi:mycothiol synthase